MSGVGQHGVGGVVKCGHSRCNTIGSLWLDDEDDDEVVVVVVVVHGRFTGGRYDFVRLLRGVEVVFLEGVAKVTVFFGIFSGSVTPFQAVR